MGVFDWLADVARGIEPEGAYHRRLERIHADAIDTGDFADYHCRYCGHEWRVIGNGGLVFGCYPDCPECGTPLPDSR
jgi:hypothetical protein